MSYLSTIFISGCTDLPSNETITSYNLTNIYSNGGISFKYPSDFNETVAKIYAGDNEHLITLACPDNKTKIGVSKSSLNPNLTVKELKDLSIRDWKSDSSLNVKIISDKQVNITGVPEAYEIITTSTDPDTKVFKKEIFLILGKQGQVAYSVEFSAPYEEFSNTKSLYEQILPTIKIETI